MSKRTRRQRKNRWLNELDDIIRGVSGGFLFGIPLLYTMEVWWIGSANKPQRSLVALIATFIVVFLLNRTAGFRKTQDIRPVDAVIDSFEALAIGIICAMCLLVLLREITSETSLGEALGKVIFESVPFTLGVALASQFLSNGQTQNQNEEEPGVQQQSNNGKQVDKRGLNATLADIGATLIGATIIAFNIAPTDEIPMLAAAVSPLWLLAIMAASLVIS